MNPDELRARSTGLPDAVVRYAAHDDGLVDVHLPEGAGPAPLVVLWHGGFWKAAHDRRHTRPVAEALARLGYAVATPEYRRVGAGGGWPSTFEDVSAAMHALPDLLAGIGVETTATTLLGHSAGGQIALWLANEEDPVDRVVALAPAGDLRFAADHDLGGGAAAALLGGAPSDVPERYDAADPATRLEQRPSCTVVVVHGTHDDAVPVASSRGLVARLPWLDYRELSGVGHMDLVDPWSEAWPAVAAALAS